MTKTGGFVKGVGIPDDKRSSADKKPPHFTFELG